MEKKFIIVTGFFGAPIQETARALSQKHRCAFVDLDDEIVKADGRTIPRIVMTFGEHAYRNKEYEMLKELAESPEDMVIACGDGVLHDDDSREIIARGRLVIAGRDMSCDDLWENAKAITDSYHAFMSFGTEEDKKIAFAKLHERQIILFDKYGGDAPEQEEL